MDHEEFEDYLEMARALLGSYEGPGDLWEANDYVNVALTLRPTDAAAWLLKSQVLSSLEDDPAALAAAEMAVREAPENAEPLFIRAAVLADLERFADALRDIETAFCKLGGDDEWLVEDLYYEKAAILDALERPEEAVATFEAGLLRCPESLLLRAGLEPLHRERVRRTFQVIQGGKQGGDKQLAEA